MTLTNSSVTQPRGGVLVFAFAIFCYVAFLAAMGLMALFLLNLGPAKVSGPVQGPVATALAGNLFLVFLFGFTHSLLARDAVKERLYRFTGETNYRSVYVLQAAIFLTVLLLGWQPIGPVLWDVQGPVAWMISAGVLIGLAFTFYATFAFDHFELFGLKQAFATMRGTAQPNIGFRVPPVYRHVRHPMMTGVIIAFLSTPLMTVGHAVFAGAMIGYVLVGVYFEERSLRRHFPDDYTRYAQKVPMLIPSLRARW